MKAQLELSTLIGLVLSLVVLVVLGTIIGGFVGVFHTEQAGQTCRLSVEAQLLTSIGGFPSPFDIYCPRKVVLIQQDQATVSQVDVYAERWTEVFKGEFVEKLRRSDEYRYTSVYEEDGRLKPRPPTISPEQEEFEQELPRVFTSELAECWDIFSRGRKAVIRDQTMIDRQETCVVCSEIILARDFTPFDAGIQGALGEPHAYTGSEDYSYMEFLYNNRQPSQSGTCFRDHVRTLNNLRVNPGESYAIVFLRSGSRYGSGDNPLNAFVGALGWDWGYTDADAGEGWLCQTVAVVPLDEVPHVCDTVVN